MSRTALSRRLLHAIRIGNYCERQNLPSSEGVEQLAYLHARSGLTRRQFLADFGKLASAGRSLPWSTRFLVPLPRGQLRRSPVLALWVRVWRVLPAQKS